MIALYHYHRDVISRAKGASVIAAAAYRAGEKLFSERYGETSDYTHKHGVVCSGILLPDHAPKEYANRQTLWNAVEKIERRRDAQLAYSDEFSFQNEFTYEENLELALRFLHESFVSKGLICDYAVHDPECEPGGTANPHIHVLIPMRAIDANGRFGKKQEQVFVLDADGNRIWDEDRRRYKTESRSCNGLDKRGTLEDLRARWAQLCNEEFAEKGFDIRLDNRSYERQGVDKLAQIHEGPAVHAMEKKGVRTEIGDYNRFVRQLNAVIRETERKLKELREWLHTAREELNQLPNPEEPSLSWVVQEQLKNLPSRGKTLRGLQEASQALIDLQEMGIPDADALEAKVKEASEAYRELTDRVKANQARVKKLEEALKQYAVYKKYLPVKQALNERKYQFTKAREKYKAEHDSELILFERARRIIKETCAGEKMTAATAEAWRKEVAALKASLAEEEPKVKTAREEMLKLRGIQNTLEGYLKPRREVKHEHER